MIKKSLVLATCSFILFGLVTTCLAKRDPTNPVVTLGAGKKDKSTALTVNAIYVSSSHRSAVINGQMVKAGSLINGVKIISIRKDAVWIKKNGQRKKLYLTPPLIKTGSKK